MKFIPAVLSVSALVLLGACGSEPSVSDIESESGLEAYDDSDNAGRNEVAATDFAQLQLGAKIVGPNGPTPSGPIMNADGQQVGTITSYVACPAGTDRCVPGELPADTVYTYVHTVTPAIRAAAFNSAMPVGGFTGTAGFDQAEASASLPGGERIEISCVNGALAWTLLGGSGWSDAPLTFFWQSTLPPAGPAPDGYELVAGGTPASGPGPAPAPGGQGCS